MQYSDLLGYMDHVGKKVANSAFVVGWDTVREMKMELTFKLSQILYN